MMDYDLLDPLGSHLSEIRIKYVISENEIENISCNMVDFSPGINISRCESAVRVSWIPTKLPLHVI